MMMTGIIVIVTTTIITGMNRNADIIINIAPTDVIMCTECVEMRGMDQTAATIGHNGVTTIAAIRFHWT
jgi:hypothetical protein